MHPIIALRQLDGLPREITMALSSAKGPVSQTEIINRLPRHVRASQSPVSRALAELIQTGIVVKTGTTRNAPLGSVRRPAASLARPTSVHRSTTILRSSAITGPTKPGGCPRRRRSEWRRQLATFSTSSMRQPIRGRRRAVPDRPFLGVLVPRRQHVQLSGDGSADQIRSRSVGTRSRRSDHDREPHEGDPHAPWRN